MIITQVRTSQPIALNSPPDWRTSLGQIVVRIQTDVGLIGYGVGGGGLAGMHVIREVLSPLLVGQEAEPVESHWQRMYNVTLPFGRKGIALMAISGVDLALWDLRAKKAGQSVYKTIRKISAPNSEVGPSGSPATSLPAAIPAYTTVWDNVDAETAAAPQAVKLHVHPAQGASLVTQVVERVHAAREAIGPNRELMIDAWMEWDIETTLGVAEQIASLSIGWIEEPLPADDLAGYEELCRHSPIPIAGGEHEFGPSGFRELIDRKLHDVVQPDACWCGGMTTLVEVYRMAAQAGVRVVPHRGAEVWGLHAISALDPQPLAESGRPWMSWVDGQPVITDGKVGLSEAPGFGVTIDDPGLRTEN